MSAGTNYRTTVIRSTEASAGRPCEIPRRAIIYDHEGCMDTAAFRESLKNATPPAELSPALEGLWWDAKGNWTNAHESAQRDEGPDGSWVHAYLHRKEGDLANARYWYRRADRAAAYGDFEKEWAAIVTWLLRHTSP